MPQTDKCIPVIPTKQVDVNKGDVRQPEYRSGLCGEEIQRWDPAMPETLASMGRLECVMGLTLGSADVEGWGKWCVGTEDHLHGCFQGTHCQADATSEMEIELPPEEQVKGRGLDRRTLEVATLDAKGRAQPGEEVAEGAYSQHSLRQKDDTRNVFIVLCYLSHYIEVIVP